MDFWLQKAEKAAIDYSFHMNLTHFDEQVAKDIPSLVEMGITTLKVFTAYNGRLRLDDGSIFKALRIAKENGMLVMLHAENGDVIETLVPDALIIGAHDTRVACPDETCLGRSGSRFKGSRHGVCGGCATIYRPYECGG